MKGLYPGSFDPITIGHLDMIERASRICDELIIVIMKNPNKKYEFTEKERKEL
ncbi:MAG: adenylyltransferase/cytidyltransferase family protein, partial [Erysipelotrichaceae bacterium]|nr:adenylyltransferase/cytidyltransferase family protein [Erysipelotrichaceae bacterium]